MAIHTYIQQQIATNKPMLALLLDPDDYTTPTLLSTTIHAINNSNTSFILIGGSVLTQPINFDEFVGRIQSITSKPVILFPGNGGQISARANAVLLLSLVSGRNAQYLIGEHVNNATALQQSGLEILPTGYILIDAGHATSVSTVTNTTPIPANNMALAANTALAATQLGMNNIYLEAGSGANNTVNAPLITAVKNTISTTTTLWVGGGINNTTKAMQAIEAGANIIVVGNAIVNNTRLITELSNIFV